MFWSTVWAVLLSRNKTALFLSVLNKKTELQTQTAPKNERAEKTKRESGVKKRLTEKNER